MAGAGGAGCVRAERGTGSLVRLLGGGGGEVDLGRRWRAWWRSGEQERREQAPEGLCWRFRERGRRRWVVEARWGCGERERRGSVRRAGGERERRGLRDRAPSLESGQSEGVGGSLGGLAWCPLVLVGGGGVPRPPLIRGVGVRWRQWLVIWVE